jgi:L-asparaginase II
MRRPRAQRHRAALATIAAAMRAHPELVGSSTGRVDTELMRTNSTLVAKSQSALLAKGGAEGYFCIGHADGLGLQLKIIDADPAARARNLATVVAIPRWLHQ